MDIVAEIRRIAESELTDQSQFIVDVIVSSKQGPRKILVLLDSDNGIKIDECADLSRALSNVLDEVTWLEDSYLLEVSTPGLDHPLKLKRQYHKNIGRRLKVKVLEKIEEGKLVAVADEMITLEQEIGTGKKKEIKTIGIPFTDIEKAFVLVSFK
ncbi:ribosome maturation factor RimP [Ohtaekwangia koreensis]|uniref:Ribosome maturation factor RimP n=1 Tax=Ohtaekwangia koreensis TaxID=688867 RepID=A0A1T5LHK6_9BACT|nr:ribosome maturation factor RimP [Ohtaekwangia koreensis]SKC75496.1 ribosome maturation factor RimP [Ohtaekwangia koreensis]